MRPPFRAALSPQAIERIVLAVIVAAAFGVRIWSLGSGVPHAVGIDEPAIVDRALRILNTGDWNPHVFDYPTLVIYLHAVIAMFRFIIGASRGEWGSLAAFDVTQVYLTGRFVSAAIGAATVWMTHRVGREAGSERVGLLAAAQLAILPLHVRESHFILTDVPVTALTTTTLLFALRIERVGAWWPGFAAGLAAAAKYNGGLVLIAVWTACATRRVPRLRSVLIATAAAAVAFVLTTPYSVLDLPAFLEGYAAQMARFAATRLAPEPVWMTYLKHFALASRFWLILAAVGLAFIVARRAARTAWLPILTFAGLYCYILSTHPVVFARYALPLTPVVCLLAAAGADALVRMATASPLPHRALVRTAGPVLVVLPVLVAFGIGVTGWQRQFARRDTRDIVTDWLKAGAPPGTRIAVENSGPTYLKAAGFEVTNVELLSEHPVEWYANQGIQYLIVSSGQAWSAGYGDAGRKMFDVPASLDRTGPAVRIVRLQ
jgi:4-amino-4-deoxy-L-arabinose transferase-like glycosyltransferase